MGRKQHTAEQIIQKLREMEVRTAKGERAEDAVLKVGWTNIRLV